MTALSGGAVALSSGPTVTVPPGAVAADTVIAIQLLSTSSPSGGPLYGFGPDGTTFSKPVQVALPIPAGTASPMVYWSRAGSSSDYDALPTTTQGTLAVAEVTHFSQGFVASAGLVCSAGACSPAPRTIDGKFQLALVDGAGATTTSPLPQPALTSLAALVQDASGDYVAYPGTLRADGSFTIPGVPPGHYFFTTLDSTGYRWLGEASADTVTSTVLVARRPDAVLATAQPTVALSLTGLDPWTPGGLLAGDLLQIVGASVGLDDRPFDWHSASPPSGGATSYAGAWSYPLRSRGLTVPEAGLPDAARGDVLWITQAVHGSVGTGAAQAVTRHVTRYAEVTDLTLADGGSGQLAAALAPPPQTGGMSANVKKSQFEALAAVVSAGATPGWLYVDVYGAPHGAAYPFSSNVSPVLLFLAVPAGAPDTDYGSIAYGQFLPAPWVEVRQVTHDYAVTIAAPAGTVTWTASLYVGDVMSALTGAEIAPRISPVQQPRLNGQDASTGLSGVGTQPTLSWAAPAIGSPTSYAVQLFSIDGTGGPEVTTAVSYAVIRTGTSFKVPPGVLQASKSYFAVITAFQAPWDALDADLLLSGNPFDSADCVTAAFTP